MGSNILVDKLKKKFHSTAWNNFIYEFFERSDYEQWHDGIDSSMLLKLTEEEKDAAEQILIYSAEKGGMWPTVGLATIKSKKAVPILEKKLKSSSRILRIRIAHALEKIEGNGKYVPILIEELNTKGYWGDRLEAAMYLRDYPSEEGIGALYEGVMDEDYLVRYHSADSLLFIHGMKPDIAGRKEIFPFITTKNKKGENSSKEFTTAANMLKELFKNKKYKQYP